MKLDLLAFAVHPDDAELSCSGTLLRHIDAGYKVGVVDLTRGELGTRGSAETRAAEAEEATRILGLHTRENLNLADGFFRNTPEQQMPVIQAIRKYRPEVVLCNSVSDRHPDHGRSSELVKEACFYSGLPKIATELDGKQQEHWRPKAVYHYIQDNYLQPDFVVDITPFMEKRIAAMRAYRTQIFVPGVDVEGIETPISSEIFWEYMMARLRLFGRLIGVEYGEGFNTGRAIGVDDILKLG